MSIARVVGDGHHRGRARYARRSIARDETRACVVLAGAPPLAAPRQRRARETKEI